jgi:hypothetical protein
LVILVTCLKHSTSARSCSNLMLRFSVGAAAAMPHPQHTYREWTRQNHSSVVVVESLRRTIHDVRT